MEKLKITIEGSAGSGKTVLLRELTVALLEAGHDVTEKDWDKNEIKHSSNNPISGVLKKKASFVIETKLPLASRRYRAAMDRGEVRL